LLGGADISLEFDTLRFPVSYVSLLPVHLAKQAAINHRATAVMAQASVPVAQLVATLS
jgi:hypothetical protein